MQAVIQIGQVKGLVNDNQNILSVVLDMDKGAFSANNIEMSDQENITFNEAVKRYFLKHPVKFIINSLDLTDIASLPDLKPHQFWFQARKTKSGNQMLQLLIQTNEQDVPDYRLPMIDQRIQEPIPEGSECSLMISSRIFFGSVLPKSLTNQWKLKGSNLIMNPLHGQESLPVPVYREV